MKRGLLDTEDLGLHPKFASFIQRKELAHREKHPMADERSQWNLLRVPLATAVAAVCAAFGASEPQLLVGGVLGPTLLAGVPALLRGLGQAWGSEE